MLANALHEEVVRLTQLKQSVVSTKAFQVHASQLVHSDCSSTIETGPTW